MNTLDANSSPGRPLYPSYDRPEQRPADHHFAPYSGGPPPRYAPEIPLAAPEDPQPKPRKKKTPPEDAPKKARKSRDASEQPPRKKAKSAADNDWHHHHQPQLQAAAYPPHPGAALPAPSPLDISDPRNTMSYDRGPPVHPTPPPSSRPMTSGQRYDPIRAASAENASNSYGASSNTTTTYRSPHSMSMLLNDPPPSAPAPHRATVPAPSAPEPRVPSSAGPRPMPQPPLQQIHHPSPAPTPVSLVGQDAAPSKNGVAPAYAPPPEVVQQPRRPSPKPQMDKDPSPMPAPIVSNGVAHADRSAEKPKEYAQVTNQCIVIEIPMNSGGGSYVNFMKEVEQKYGFDVAHPQIAEHRKRMKDMAAAGALIEAGVGSADDMNLDISDANSDGEAGGPDENSAPEGHKGRRKQRNDYDKDDDFIDDTELAWEERALASKDGYFVWSGPLVQEGDKTTVERADGTMRRGRGSGRGSRGGGRGDASSGRGRGVGRGSRGGGTGRKPRVTKADRARMENEKRERESMAATASKPAVFAAST